MAYFHRLVNGGGVIDREYGVGRGRTDLLIRWPYRDADGHRAVQRQAIELKVWREGRPDPLPDGLTHLDEYLSRLDLDEGTLVIFDRRPSAAPIDQRVMWDMLTTPGRRKITLLRA